ncbi:penicillin-binding protein 2 [Candidatus Uhrbacteria bacterium]|nr:penicillin-binding protein 2 [Candidatus Uhrbacteria bacterium]
MRRAHRETSFSRRITILWIGLVAVALITIVRLFSLQVLQHKLYAALASGQHEVFRQLFPVRGSIFVRDKNGALFPVATTRTLTLVWADLRAITEPAKTARLLAETLELDELALRAKIEPRDDPFEVIAHFVSDEAAGRLKSYELPGLGFRPEPNRFYPEQGFGGQLIGFFGSDQNNEEKGRYGIEGHYDEILAGHQGFLSAKRDPAGRLILAASRSGQPAEDGSDLVLTIDRTIQFFVCDRLAAAVERFEADGGSVVILEPKSGAILALCGAPDFDPNNFRKVTDISVFNNPAVMGAYEPGSVMKAVTMAAALDSGAVGPQTTYNDTGMVEIGPHQIQNSDLKAHGRQTMTEVLGKSLNTGVIFALNEMGAKNFQSYLERFGFGQPTGIDLDQEVSGDLSTLEKPGEIYSATASFGQGLTVTPLQLAVAFGAIANDGKLMKPYVVGEIRRPAGEAVTTVPQMRRQVISTHTATVLEAMLVSVVEEGHGRRAGVPGYFIAGKTGTAQVPRTDGRGYDPSLTIGTFTGFGPIEDPLFVMSVRIDHPRAVQFAESSAAPLFGEIAKFILQYYQVPPTRVVE